jgi:uncharacterized protein (UPF0371 family)
MEVGTIQDTLTQEDPVSDTDHLIVVSPGGGSGKFYVAVTEIAHKLRAGKNPNFIKFETFPVFLLPKDDPLNLAFLAATADLPNELITTAEGQTNYDKDVQNLKTLQLLMLHYPELASPLLEFNHPTDMGVNMITSGIIDGSAVYRACLQEVVRRIERYAEEHLRGDERHETVTLSQQYLGKISLTSDDTDSQK